MKTIRRTKFFRCIALFFTLIAVSACQTTQWKSAGFAPFDTRRELPSPARLTLNDGSTFELLDARFEADSVIGTRPAGVVATSRRWAVHVDSVKHIEGQKIYPTSRRVLLVGAGVLAAAFVITLVELDESLEGLGE